MSRARFFSTWQKYDEKQGFHTGNLNNHPKVVGRRFRILLNLTFFIELSLNPGILPLCRRRGRQHRAQ